MSQNSHSNKCPKCDNELKLIQKCTIRDKEYHLYRCLNCRRLFIENNIENEKEVFDAFIKTPEFLEEKLQYFIAYLINKGRFIYAKDYVEIFKSKFHADARLLMNELLISLRCKNEKDLQFYIKNLKDFDLLNNIIFSLENDKREKLTKFFLVSLTNCANIFGGKDLLTCDKIFENIVELYNDLKPFKKEISQFAKVCVNKDYNDIAKKYYNLIGEELKEKNYTINHSTLPNDNVNKKDKRSSQSQTIINEKEQDKKQKDKVKNFASEKKNKIKKIIFGICCVVFVIAIVIIGAFYFKGGFKVKNNNSDNGSFQVEAYYILPVEGNYNIVADYREDILQNVHGGDRFEKHQGIDFSSNTSKNVFAVKSGKITSIEKNNNGLYTIAIYHNNEIYSRYENIEKCSFSVGQIVKQGDNIGSYYGEFVHFEVVEYGIYVNPHTFYNF